MGNAKTKVAKCYPIEADGDMLKVESETCKVRVIVLKGVNLPASDDNGKTDAYVVMTLINLASPTMLKYHKKVVDDLNSEVQRKVSKEFRKVTAVQKCTRNPVWNEIHYFPTIKDITSCVLHVKIVDENKFSEDVQLGYFQIPLVYFLPPILWPVKFLKYKEESLVPSLLGRNECKVPLRWSLKPPHWGAGPGYDVCLSEVHLRVDLMAGDASISRKLSMRKLSLFGEKKQKLQKEVNMESTETTERVDDESLNVRDESLGTTTSTPRIS